jgi:hypothetical protein
MQHSRYARNQYNVKEQVSITLTIVVEVEHGIHENRFMDEKVGSQSVPLTHDTQWLVDHLFKPVDRADAARMLIQQCARNLSSCENADARSLERLRFAALKLSGGDLKRLSHAMREAQMDWRDLLMAADFGLDVNAHRAWLAVLRKES